MKLLIMCEGPNELKIINILLENQKLKFSSDDLLGLVPYHARQIKSSAAVKAALNLYPDEVHVSSCIICTSNKFQTSVYKGYKQDKIEMRGDRAEMSDFPLYLNTVAGGLDRRDQTIGGFSFVVKIYTVPVVEIIG